MSAKDIATVAKVSEPALALCTDGISPTKYVDVLENQKLFKDAVLFLSYGLPIQIGIEWGDKCCRELLPADAAEKNERALKAVEAWLGDPSDANRRAANDAARSDDDNTAGDVLGMAVFLSGGSITPPGKPETPPPAYVAQKLTATAISMAVLGDKPKEKDDRYKQALQMSRDIVKQQREK